MKKRNTPTAQERATAALSYFSRNWRVTPVEAGEKRPILPGWQKRELTIEELKQHYRKEKNIGVVLGNASGGLVDVDLDSPEAAQIAPHFLPETGMIFGRGSRPRTHWVYLVTPAPSTKKFLNVNEKMIVEVRSNGCQTVFPPGTHSSGEVVTFQSEGEPSQVDANHLDRQVRRLAAACVLASAWPAPGSRQDTTAALIGGLAREGWSPEETGHFITAVVEAARDEELSRRLSAIDATYRTVDMDGKATGLPTLARLVGQEVVDRVREWLFDNKAYRGDTETRSRLDQITHTEAKAMLDELLLRSISDPGAPFEEASLRTMFTLQQNSYPDWIRLRTGLKEALGAKLNLRELDARLSDLNRTGPARHHETLPGVEVSNRQLRDISNDALRAFKAWNVPARIFNRNGVLVRLQTVDNGHPVIDLLDASKLRGILGHVANFYKRGEQGLRDTIAPQPLLEDLLNRANEGFPALKGVITGPTLRPDGSVLAASGYDPDTGLYLALPNELSIPPISDEPKPDELKRAVSLVDDILADFPFAEPASRANAWALLLTTLLRPSMSGNVPMAVISAPVPGSGKGLLAEVTSIIGTGRNAAMGGAPENDGEWRKQITAALLRSVTFIMFDNIRAPLGGEALERALTAADWSDRLLGSNRTVILPQCATWVAAGNNVRLAGDMARRCFWIRLDPKSARPWTRAPSKFRHPQLKEWVREQRGELLWALLTLARSWYVAGKPATSAPILGGFEPWCRTIGGTLAHAGIDGFLGNLKELYATADQEANDWEAFLTVCRSLFPDGQFTAAELGGKLRSEPELTAALPDELAGRVGEGPEGFQRRLGKALVRLEHRRFGEAALRIERAGRHPRSGCIIWRIAAG